MIPLCAQVCAGGRSLGDPLVSPDGTSVAFVSRGAGGGRLVVVPVAGGAEALVAADPEPASRGGVVAWLPGGRLAYVTRDGDVAVVDPAGAEGPRLVVTAVEGGASGLAASPDGSALAFVADTRAVTVVPVDGGAATVVSAAADFALDPAWAPDGGRLAWHEWDVPAMPWDASRVAMAAAAGRGGDGTPVVVAGGPGESVQEPRWAPDGSALAFLSDATGWCNLWLADPDGSAPRPLLDERAEHGGPAWGAGARSFAWSTDARSIAFCRNEAGFGRLCVVDVATAAVRELAHGVFSSLSWAGHHIVAVRSGARTPNSVVAVHVGEGTRRILATGPDPALVAAAEALPEPEVVSWEAADGAVVHGRLWRPPGAGTSPPPMLVWAHGGPTDQRRVTFDPRLAFYLSRGWAVLHPDHRGSTGWGRAWAQALQGRWGEVDVDATLAGAEAAVARGWAHPAGMVAMGASAGGMTALLLLARRPELWAAGVALYPVVDLVDLAAATHRFEAHYTVGLVGPLPETAERHRARSPLAAAARITAPVLLLHGGDDPVVPASQSRELAELLRSREVAVEHHEYEGEGHGWRSPATTADELERTDSFLFRHGLPRDADMGR